MYFMHITAEMHDHRPLLTDSRYRAKLLLVQ